MIYTAVSNNHSIEIIRIGMWIKSIEFLEMFIIIHGIANMPRVLLTYTEKEDEHSMTLVFGIWLGSEVNVWYITIVVVTAMLIYFKFFSPSFLFLFFGGRRGVGRRLEAIFKSNKAAFHVYYGCMHIIWVISVNRLLHYVILSVFIN